MAVHDVVTEVGAEPASQRWLPWRVSPASGFEVAVDPDGDGHVEGDVPGGAGTAEVGLVQIDGTTFLVTNRFRFTDADVQADLIEHLERQGMAPAEAQARVDDARTFTPTTENPTDLASVPRFMRWFENPYGAHTLAAIIHDDLIVDEPNGGALASDTLADRFFREMMHSAGVPWLKRWLMWAAVALRTRWAAGGARRVSVVAWLVLALGGIAAFGWGVGAGLFGWEAPMGETALLAGAVVLPVLASGLWGKQAGAGLIAAVGAAWILPAAVFGGFGYLVYRALEALAGTARLR